MLLFRECGMGLALICALVTFIIGHVPTWLLGCRGHDRSPLCAKPDEVEAEVEVVVVEVKLSVVVARGNGRRQPGQHAQQVVAEVYVRRFNRMVSKVFMLVRKSPKPNKCMFDSCSTLLFHHCTSGAHCF